MARRRESGSVFVLTLAVLAGLVVLMSTLLVSHRETVDALANRRDESRAQLMADAGIQRAIAEIQQANAAQTLSSDSWAKLGNGGATEFLSGPDSFRLQIQDADARVNINTVGEDQLKRLPMTAEQVASLEDWRDSNKTARPNGAKDDYYNGLSNPYNTKMQPFDSVPELLLVKGFTPQTLYSPNASAGVEEGSNPTNYDGQLADLLTSDSSSEDMNVTGQPRVDIRSATVDQLVAVGVPTSLATSIVQSAGSFQKLGDVVTVQGMTIQAATAIADNFTVGAPAARSGLLNLNTASETALASIPGLNPDVTESILEYQSTGFKGVGDLLDVPGVSLSVFSQLVDNVCVSSRAFLVRVMGTAGSAHVAIETNLVVGDDGQVRITRLEPQPAWHVLQRWGWSDTTSDQVIIGGGS